MAPFAHVFRQECIRAKKSGLRSLWLQLEICERIGLDLDKAFVADVLRVHHSNSKYTCRQIGIEAVVTGCAAANGPTLKGHRRFGYGRSGNSIRDPAAQAWLHDDRSI
jgi:hypothetical protein